MPVPVPVPVPAPAPVVVFCLSRILVPASSRRPFLHRSPPSSSHRLAGAMSAEAQGRDSEGERWRRWEVR